jgi:hypothetical protein
MLKKGEASFCQLHDEPVQGCYTACQLFHLLFGLRELHLEDGLDFVSASINAFGGDQTT